MRMHKFVTPEGRKPCPGSMVQVEGWFPGLHSVTLCRGAHGMTVKKSAIRLFF